MIKMKMDWMDIGPKAKPKPNLLKKTLQDYYFERIEDKSQSYGNIYAGTHYAPATEMEIGRRELSCLDNKLVQERQIWKKEKEGFERRWKVAIAKSQDLTDTIPKFNGYYKDTFAKKERALSSFNREKEQTAEKMRELRRLQKELEKFEELKLTAKQRLEKFSIFQTYLDEVKKASQGEYNDVREIIDRYTILADARQTLHRHNDDTREFISKRQKALESDILMKSNEVLAYRNYLSELLEYHRSLQEQTQRLDDHLLRIKTTAAQRTMVIGQIKMAIQNLYFQVCKHMHRFAKITTEDTLGQLRDIRISVKEMFKLNKDIKHMLKAAYVAAEAEKTTRERVKRIDVERMRRMDKMRFNAATDAREIFGMPPVVIGQKDLAIDRLFQDPKPK